MATGRRGELMTSRLVGVDGCGGGRKACAFLLPSTVNASGESRISTPPSMMAAVYLPAGSGRTLRVGGPCAAVSARPRAGR